MAAARSNGSPNQRLLRALKVGKEEIAGLVAAVRRYTSLDHQLLWQQWDDAVRVWASELRKVPGLNLQRFLPDATPQAPPRTPRDRR